MLAVESKSDILFSQGRLKPMMTDPNERDLLDCITQIADWQGKDLSYAL